MDLEETGYESVDWIRLADDRVQFRVLVNTIMNFRVVYSTTAFLTSRPNINLSKRSLPHGVN
jgi:hypothetical protein